MAEIDLDNDGESDWNPMTKWIIIGVVILIAIVAFVIYAFNAGHPAATIVNGTTVSDNVPCKFNNGVPDTSCTPGTLLPVPRDGLCSPTYTQPVIDRNTELEVFRSYGITDIAGWKVEHWIPVELGGSNDVTNLFPMAENPKPGYVERDKATKKLKDLVCANKIPLASAQYMITHDWQSNTGLYN